MREYNNYPSSMENNNNSITTEIKKPKFYLVTSKVVNLLAIFVATISVSTFFATRYIGIGDIFFSANILSTMLSLSLLIVILEIYAKKNAIKTFMAGAYAILLVFFISAFIPDFNPIPMEYYQTSFINFHQTILLAVFISYTISFLVCIKVYLYFKDNFNMPYIWVGALPSVAIAQALYTIFYQFIYHGFSNFDLIATDIKHDLYLKSFMTIISILIIYFIISGIKIGFFDFIKNIFSKKCYDDDDEYRPMKSVYNDSNEQDLQYRSPLMLENNLKRKKRSLPDYSKDYGKYDLPISLHHNQSEEHFNPSRRSRKEHMLDQYQNSKQERFSSSKRPSRSSSYRSSSSNNFSRNKNNSDSINDVENHNNPNMNNIANNSFANKKFKPIENPRFSNNKSFANKNKPFTNNQIINNKNLNRTNFGNIVGTQEKKSFFTNKFPSNNKPTMNNTFGGFSNMNINKNNIWNKR